MSHYRAPPNTGIDMRYVQPYTPKCCADTSKPANLDPRRTSVYRPPVVSRSEPLSASEYLARKKALGNTAVSAPSSLVQYSTGKYAQTIWTTSGACCSDAPKVPAVHPGGYAKPEGLRIEAADALAARNSTSEWDKVNRDASTTTLQRQGQAIGAQTGCCDEGGTTIYPGIGPCNCPEIEEETSQSGPPSGLPDIEMWFDPADPTKVSVTNNLLTGFTDKAGNNNSGTGYNNLPFQTNSINGLPTVRFTGTGIWPSLVSAQANANFVRITNSNFNEPTVTYIFVVNYISGTGGFLGTDNPSLFGRGIGINNGNIQVIYNNNFETLSSPTLSIPSGTPTILCVQFANGPNNNLTPGAIRVSVNGTQTEYLRNQAPPDNTFGFNLGGWNPTNTGNTVFDLGEVLVYVSQLTELERQKAEGYLAWKWGLQGNLPSGHPYKNAPPY